MHIKRSFTKLICALLICATMAGLLAGCGSTPMLFSTNVASISNLLQEQSTNSSSTETTGTDGLTAEQRNSINMLNYLTVVVQEINTSKNRLFLESTYNDLINNTEPSIVDDQTLDEYEKILGVIEKYRLIDVKRERLQYVYEQESAQNVFTAVPNPLSVLNVIQSGNPLKIIASVAYMAIDSATSYASAKSATDLQYLQDGWDLDDEESQNLADSRSSMFAYMVRMARNLPKGITLNEDYVEDFVKWENESNVDSRIRWFESNQDIYKNYGEYWLVLADSYYEKGDFSKCLSAVTTYEGLDNSIFRKDTRLAQSLPNAIVSARETLGGMNYINTARTFANMIIDNTNSDDWSLRYFAAQTFLDLYAKTKNQDYLESAYEIAYDNVNELKAEQQSLNATYLSELQLESTKGETKDEKKEIENYNKYLKEVRKTELAPVYEPLRLNCDLLFALANVLQLTDTQKNSIDSILHPNGDTLFLNPALDNMYRFSPSSTLIDENDMDVSFDKTKITIPANILTDNYTIIVALTLSDGSTQTINDWTLESVDRHKSNNIEDFTATLSSNSAKDIKNSAISSVNIVVNPIGTSTENIPNAYQFKFEAKDKKVLFFTSSSFIRQET